MKKQGFQSRALAKIQLLGSVMVIVGILSYVENCCTQLNALHLIYTRDILFYFFPMISKSFS